MRPQVVIKNHATSDTLRAMQCLMDAFGRTQPMRDLALRIVKGAKPHGKMGEALLIQNWIAKYVPYRRDPVGSEWLQYPDLTLELKAGDCDDLATLAGALLQSIGHRCQARAITWAGADSPSHAVCADLDAGIIIDPVANLHPSQWPPKGYSVGSWLGAEMNGGQTDLDGFFSNLNPFKAVSSLVSKTSDAMKSVTSALPITRRFNDFTVSTGIRPAMAAFDPQSGYNKLISGGLISGTLEAQRLVERGTSRVSASDTATRKGLETLDAAAGKTLQNVISRMNTDTEKAVKWERENPAILQAIGAIATAIMSVYTFGAWGALVGGAIKSVAAEKIPPGGIQTGDQGMGIADPAVTSSLAQWAENQGIQCAEIKFKDGTILQIPLIPEAICDGTRAALEFLRRAVANGKLKPSVAAEAARLLGQTTQDAVDLGWTAGDIVAVNNEVHTAELWYRDQAALNQDAPGLAPEVSSASNFPWIAVDIGGLGLFLLTR